MSGSEHIILLPYRLTAPRIYNLVEQAIDGEYNPLAKEMVFDFASLSFITPTGVTCLSNLIEWLVNMGVKCSFRNYQPNTEVCRYLDDSGFFEIYLGARVNKLSRVRGTTIPLKKVTHEKSHQWLDMELLPWLMYRLNMTKASLADIKTSVQEIFNNIIDHSDEKIGCVFGQHFPKMDKISIAISDFGIGIPKVMEKVGKFENDGVAILEASKMGVTAGSTKGNMGAGLDILTQIVVNNNGGSLDIRSNKGKLSCRTTNGVLSKEPAVLQGFYPGTLVDITLRTDTIEYIEDSREDLEW